MRCRTAASRFRAAACAAAAMLLAAACAQGAAPSPVPTPAQQATAGSALTAPQTTPGYSTPAPAAVVAPPSSAARVGRLEAVQHEIDAEIGAAGCDVDAQCRTVPTGARACGGPVAWRPWSTRATDANRLAPLVAEEQALSRDEARRSGRISVCALERDPGARCEQARCVLKPAGQPMPGVVAPR